MKRPVLLINALILSTAVNADPCYECDSWARYAEQSAQRDRANSAEAARQTAQVYEDHARWSAEQDARTTEMFRRNTDMVLQYQLIDAVRSHE